MAKIGSHNIFFLKKKKAAITFSHGSREVQTVLILAVVVGNYWVDFPSQGLVCTVSEPDYLCPKMGYGGTYPNHPADGSSIYFERATSSVWEGVPRIRACPY